MNLLYNTGFYASEAPKSKLSPTVLWLCREHGAKAIDVALCGPAGLLQRVRAALHDNGVPAGNLRHELFEFR